MWQVIIDNLRIIIGYGKSMIEALMITEAVGRIERIY